MLGIAKGCELKYQTLLLRLRAAHTVFATLCSYRFDTCYLANKMKRQCSPAETRYSMAYASTRYDGRGRTVPASEHVNSHNIETTILPSAHPSQLPT